ncbi:MAG: GNAT family N-acetyltransferase [Clostridia bacterium]|nr:GNAT family N-acetyltransferase [Clostridia bacterium]
MDIRIEPFTKNKIIDVVTFEKRLREEEDVWGWEIDDAYLSSVEASFSDRRFISSLSFLAYVDGAVVGRIDCDLIASRFDGTLKAYLDWICVLKSYRHNGVAQALMRALTNKLKADGITSLVALTASNDEAQRFYKAVENSSMHDIGIWIDIK